MKKLSLKILGLLIILIVMLHSTVTLAANNINQLNNQKQQNKEKINDVKDDLVMRAAHLCAWADYPEEDIEEIEFDTLKNSLKNSVEKLSDLLLIISDVCI